MRNLKKAICIYCKKEFFHRRKIQKYCSRKCMGKSYTTSIEKKCKICRNIFYSQPNSIKSNRGKYCSRQCKDKDAMNINGKKASNWRGGRTITRDGYVSIYQPNHPLVTKRGYVLEHRLVIEKHLGRYLTRKEIVHHRGIKYPIDSIANKQDNRIENLMLLPNLSKHRKIHKKH